MAKKKQPQDPTQNKWEEFAKNVGEDGVPDQQTDDQLDLKEVKPDDIQSIDSESPEELEQKLNVLEMKVNDYKDQAIRAKAEMENLRRRAERDVQNAHKYGSEKLLSDLLPVVDSLVRGLEGEKSGDKNAQALHEGMQLTLDLLEKTLEKHGVVVIHPEKGDTFNPERHEAMTMQPDPEAEPNTILQVLQKGYELNGRVVRAAMVIVVQ